MAYKLNYFPLFFTFLAQLSTEARVDIGFNPLKLFSDASVNSCLVESSTASASTHDTNQVSLKWKGTQKPPNEARCSLRGSARTKTRPCLDQGFQVLLMRIEQKLFFTVLLQNYKVFDSVKISLIFLHFRFQIIE